MKTRFAGLLLTGSIIAGLIGPACAARAESDSIRVEGGSFQMGTPRSQINSLRSRYGVSFPGSFESEIPEHKVTLGSFLIDPYEVTNQRFAAFVAARPEWGPGRLAPERHNGRYLELWEGDTYPEEIASQPVVFVTWHAAQSFCTWAGGRLPTEAEWEYAARSRGDSEFPWGDQSPSPDLANYGASELGTTTPVGIYPPNPLGIHDLAGNVWEWVLDEWAPHYLSEAQDDPVSGGLEAAREIKTVSGRRTIRGGSFGGAVVNLRTRWRDSHEATNAREFVGFRCVYPSGQ